MINKKNMSGIMHNKGDGYKQSSPFGIEISMMPTKALCRSRNSDRDPDRNFSLWDSGSEFGTEMPEFGVRDRDSGLTLRNSGLGFRLNSWKFWIRNWGWKICYSGSGFGVNFWRFWIRHRDSKFNPNHFGMGSWSWMSTSDCYRHNLPVKHKTYRNCTPG